MSSDAKDTAAFITTTQTPSVNGLFYGHSQKSTDSSQRFGLIQGNRVPENGGGGGLTSYASGIHQVLQSPDF